MIDINMIYNEDCLTTMSKIEDNTIDLVLTSPPYDNLRDYKGFKFDFENTAKELFRIIKAGGVVVWVVGDQTVNGSETGTSFKQALYFKECGFKLYDTMIYRKQNYIPLTHKRYEQEFEYMFVFSKGKPKTFNPIMIECKTKGSKTKGRTFYQTNNQNTPTTGHKNDAVKDYKQKGNVWQIPTNAGTKGHPAQFPEILAIKHISTWTNKNDLIYDPFMGSGTTAVASLKLQRNYLGSEIDNGYIKIGLNRINPIKTQTKIF